MKTILITYCSLTAGGSTTSLLSLLSVLNYQKYRVSLQLFYKGDLESLIPREVNILPYLFYSHDEVVSKRKRNPISLLTYVKALFFDKVLKRPYVRHQIMALDTIRYCRCLKNEYDISISYLENAPAYYNIKKVKAKRKITWIHTDYKDAALNSDIDKKIFGGFETIVLVSKPNKIHFDEIFPQFANRSVVIENILIKDYIQKRAAQTKTFVLPKVNERTLRFVTTCRITFDSKGLDRGVVALDRLNKENLISPNFIWYILGDGQDFNILKKMITESNLENYIVLCGKHNNPLPIIKDCDVFFLPSRFEGKPMAVTEAQMLGLLPVVTEYASARIQINNGYNGIVLQNSDDAIYEFLKQCMLTSAIINNLKPNVAKEDYSNQQEYIKIEQLLDK